MGVDLADISRVESLLERYPRFAERCFTEHERSYARRFASPARRYAARFAGKEAVMKSLGTGYRRIRWTDVEITGGGNHTILPIPLDPDVFYLPAWDPTATTTLHHRHQAGGGDPE